MIFFFKSVFQTIFLGNSEIYFTSTTETKKKSVGWKKSDTSARPPRARIDTLI